MVKNTITIKKTILQQKVIKNLTVFSVLEDQSINLSYVIKMLWLSGALLCVISAQLNNVNISIEKLPAHC